MRIGEVCLMTSDVVGLSNFDKEPPTQRPWGARNMSFLDPDGNLITFRSFPKESTTN